MAKEFLLAGTASYRADCWLQASTFDTRKPIRHCSMDRENTTCHTTTRVME